MEKDIIIIKVGTSTLTTEKNGNLELDRRSFSRIGKQIIELETEGYRSMIVSSAAITAGMSATNTRCRPSKSSEMPELQRLASIGWRHVLNTWDKALPGKNVGELLITKNELALPHERDEALRVAHSLIEHNDILVANENDAIAHDEIAYGDNDTLAATLAAKIAGSNIFSDQVSLVLLSDVDGVYEDFSDIDSVIPIIDDLDEYMYLAGDSRSKNASGGMRTKFEAARIAINSGVNMWVANGREHNAIQRTMSGEIGTKFATS